MTEKKCPWRPSCFFFKIRPKNTFNQDFVMMNISCEFEISAYKILFSRGPTKLLAESRKNVRGGHLVFLK